MKVDLLILQLAVVFLPGIIWARLDANYAAKVKPTELEFVVRAFIFGLVIYVAEFILFASLGWPFTLVDLADASKKEIFTKAVLIEITWCFILTPPLALMWLWSANYKWLTWTLQRLKATKKYGDEDVWDRTFNSSDAVTEYVHVRDFANQCVYAGWVNTFSETDKIRELVLLDVIVYNFESEELYRVPRLYLARQPDNIHIEFPYKPEREEPPND